jgi:hypothetical protein
MKVFNLSGFALALTLILAGCGGGGDGGSSSGAGSTPTTPATPVVPVAVAAKLQTAVTPTYSATSEEFGYFTAVNAFRSVEGLGPLNQNPFYDLAAAAHAAYVDVNGPSHGEIAGLAGFTAVSPILRVQHQGGTTNGVGEVLGLPDFELPDGSNAPGAGVSLAGVLINTVYHRAGLLFQGVTDVGISIGMTPTQQIGVSDMGYVTEQVNAGTYFGMYPVDGQTGVGLHMHPEEPSPVPAGTDIMNVGYPISVASQESTTLTVIIFTVTQVGSTTAVPATIITQTDPNLAGINNVAFLLANQAFLPNTTYTVNVAGTITGAATGTTNGILVSKQWTFRTGVISD